MERRRLDAIEQWSDVPLPPAPDVRDVTVDPATAALLVLDMQNTNCNGDRRPRCVASLPAVRALLAAAREAGAHVIYSLTSSAMPEDIRSELTPRQDEPIVASGVDKFRGTSLEDELRARGVQTVIIVGTSAHGAVLNTATGAALRGFDVIVPVDGLSAGEAYAEQYTCWHLANSPGTRRSTTLTRCAAVTFAAGAA
jgi:nicotinamidase-related amidase